MIPLRDEILGDCEKMAIISSTGNEWPQDQVDEKGLMASTSKLMEKTGHQELSQAQQQQQPPLRCPRCDSSNTKFCYYNNYSLSQPRHFCKACKRYWTRGGTLRNVPVGGGCRKNKRVKRPASSVEGASTLVSTANPNPTSQSQIDIPSTSNHINPLFYGLSNPSEMNLPFSGRFTSSRVPLNMDITISGYRDLQSQLNPLALEFSKPGIVSAADTNAFQTGKQIQDVVSSNSLLSSYSNIFGSSSSSSITASPTIPTLLASNFEEQKLNNGIKGSRALDHFQHSNPFANLQMIDHSTESGTAMKEVKTEHGQNRLPWNIQCLNQMEQIGLSDPSVYWSTTTGAGAWYDPANMGSSVTSLI